MEDLRPVNDIKPWETFIKHVIDYSTTEGTGPLWRPVVGVHHISRLQFHENLLVKDWPDGGPDV